MSKYTTNFKWRHWTPAAIECYERDCQCDGCPIKETIETYCYMKHTVHELLDEFGEPPKYKLGEILSRFSNPQIKIIKSILKGNTTKYKIAKDLGKVAGTISHNLAKIYAIADNFGFKPSKEYDRLSEFVEFITNLHEEIKYDD